MRAATTTLPRQSHCLSHNRVDEHNCEAAVAGCGLDWTRWSTPARAAYGANTREYTHPILEVRDVGLKVLREGFDFEQSLEQLGRHGRNIPNQFLHAMPVCVNPHSMAVPSAHAALPGRRRCAAWQCTNQPTCTSLISISYSVLAHAVCEPTQSGNAEWNVRTWYLQSTPPAVRHCCAAHVPQSKATLPSQLHALECAGRAVPSCCCRVCHCDCMRCRITEPKSTRRRARLSVCCDSDQFGDSATAAHSTTSTMSSQSCSVVRALTLAFFPPRSSWYLPSSAYHCA